MLDSGKLRTVADKILGPGGLNEFERLLRLEEGAERARAFLLDVLERADINESLSQELIAKCYRLIDAAETSEAG